MKKDYCTLFPDCIFKLELGAICKQHDLDYKAQIGKLKADIKMFKSVKNQSVWWSSSVAYIMIIGVNTPIGFYRYRKSKIKKDI